MTDEESKAMEKKKVYLNSYRSMCRKLQSLEEQLETLREAEQAAKIQTLSDMPKGSKQSDLSDYIVKLDRILTKIIRQRRECMERMIEIEDRIAEVDDGTEASILHKRYIELKQWEQICVEIDYSWMQTHRLHSKALQDIMI